ncbi:MAG: tetratricopeptide repeat protein [Planctomycetota bacterium]|nr:MAG: tetratricopeptide repeat protein [Planctomycetota bacterium]
MTLAWQLAMSRPTRHLTLLLFLVGTSGGSLAQNPSQEEVLDLYRAASDAYAHQNWDLASERFRQVAHLRPATPLAMEAGFYDLLAMHRRMQIATLRVASPSETPDKFAQACSDWHCLASSWMQSQAITKTPSYLETLRGRIDSVLRIEIEQAFASRSYRQTLSLLNQIQRQTASESLELELLGLECFVQLQRWTDAENSVQSLQLRVEEELAQSPPPDWIERFLLRQAEVAMVLAKWKDAESTVWKIRTHFPECKVSAQVDYVLARCWIHEAKFEQARQLLASILESHRDTTVDLQAKTWWTLAESYLMQRNYHEAHACYEQVLKVAVDSKWAELAQRQMAMCREASGSSIADRSDANNSAAVRSTQKQMPKQSR